MLHPAELRLGGRDGSVLATKGTRAGQQTTRGVSVSPRDGSGMVGCGGDDGGGGDRDGRNGGHGARAGGAAAPFYSRARGLRGSAPAPRNVPGVNAAVRRPTVVCVCDGADADGPPGKRSGGRLGPWGTSAWHGNIPRNAALGPGVTGPPR
jgi:hypothetical protein